MADTPSSILLTREQSTGSNTNLWGGYLITTQRQTEQAAKGSQSQAMTGDMTITWTNYATGNIGQCAHLTLTGSLTSAATLTMPAYQNFMTVYNTTGQTITVKCSGGTGVAIPNSRRAVVRCDAIDYFTDTPTWVGESLTLSNYGDLVSYLQMTNAIAALLAGTVTGLILNSAADTTAGYLSNKLTVTMGGLTTTQLSGLTSVTLATKNGGANEKRRFTVGQGYVAGMLDGGYQNAQFTPVVGTAYDADISAASFTVNLTGMTTPQLGQTFRLNAFGNFTLFLLGTAVGKTNPILSGAGIYDFRWSGASWGWNYMASSVPIGPNFTDPKKFLRFEIARNRVQLYNGTVSELSTTLTFASVLNGMGFAGPLTFVADVATTVLTIAATTAGEVSAIMGPVNRNAGYQKFTITSDGAVYTSIIVSVGASERALLAAGIEIFDNPTTPGAQYQNPMVYVDTARTNLNGTGAISRTLLPIEMSKARGAPLFEFSRSFSVTITSSDSITSTPLIKSTAGVQYRTM